MHCKLHKTALSTGAVTCMSLAVGYLTGCQSPAQYRQEADEVAYKIIEQKQQQALGRTEAFTIERPADTLRRRLMQGQDLPMAAPASLSTKDIEPIEQWPDADYLLESDDPPPPAVAYLSDGPLRLTLLEALRVGARNSREYQSRKEQVFAAALRLDLERDEFRNTWAGILSSMTSANLSGADAVAGVENSLTTEMSRRLKSGATFATGLTIDLVKLLTMDKSSSFGILADATISIPLMRGSGRFVVTEPLTQADRDVVYAIYDFERFKRTFAVQIASDYLAVLQQQDEVNNATANYKRLIAGTRRARRLADEGRLPEIEIDQAIQDELRARDRWISARQTYKRRLDSFKMLLGLSTDAAIDLAYEELLRLAEAAWQTAEQSEQSDPLPDDQDVAPVTADTPVELIEPSRAQAGPFEIDESQAFVMALTNRLDLRVAVGRVFDGQRTAAVAADMLRADLTLFGSAAAGERRKLAEAGLNDASLRPQKGAYSVLATLDLPLERTAERNLYRESLINLEQIVRGVQELEDQIKFDIRDNLRNLLETREALLIQDQAVKVAERRVQSTKLFLELGRSGVQIRDVLEANDDLNSAQNARTSALVGYRVAELEMQRDLGVLEVNEAGLWREYVPGVEGGGE